MRSAREPAKPTRSPRRAPVPVWGREDVAGFDLELVPAASDAVDLAFFPAGPEESGAVECQALRMVESVRIDFETVYRDFRLGKVQLLFLAETL